MPRYHLLPSLAWFKAEAAGDRNANAIDRGALGRKDLRQKKTEKDGKRQKKMEKDRKRKK